MATARSAVRRAAEPALLPNEIKPAMQGAIPASICTCSLDGIPNATIISQVYYVDARHVALSCQFFNKTTRNARENPFVSILMIDLEPYDEWYLEARYDHSETEGPVFDNMDMQIEAIASLTGMSGVFKLKSADVYEVLAVERRSPTTG
jgi:hypothetical protein